MARRAATACTLAIVVACVLAGTAARAMSSSEASFVSRINSERSSRGLRSLAVRSDLLSVARGWSAEMASANQIWHDPDLTTDVKGWTVLGDNVGRGTDVASLHKAFMDSAPHRANILDPSYNEVGVGVAKASDGRIYVTEIFARRVAKKAPAAAPHRRIVARVVTRVAASYRIETSDVVWALQLDPRSVTVSVLEQLNALDASR